MNADYQVYVARRLRRHPTDPLPRPRPRAAARRAPYQPPRRPWQFGLRALLAVIAVLAVPFWLLRHGDAHVRFWGLAVLVPVLGGCAGYLARGWAGAWAGIGIAVLLGLAILLVGLALW